MNGSSRPRGSGETKPKLITMPTSRRTAVYRPPVAVSGRIRALQDLREIAELEEKWKARVTLSRQRFDLYSVNVKEIRELSADIPAPDGGFGLARAMRAESAALGEYVRVLRIYSDLVVYGKVPEAEEGGGPA